MQTIPTRTGRSFRFTAPEPQMVELIDIAHGLSQMCRFTCQTNQFFSVAQHCVLLSERCSTPGIALEGLLHNAFKAYTGDLSRAQAAMHGRTWAGHVDRIRSAICVRFWIPSVTLEEVKEIDERLEVTEHRDLVGWPLTKDEWGPGKIPEPYSERIEPWSPSRAFELFISRYNFLTRDRK